MRNCKKPDFIDFAEKLVCVQLGNAFSPLQISLFDVIALKNFNDNFSSNRMKQKITYEIVIVLVLLAIIHFRVT